MSPTAAVIFVVLVGVTLYITYWAGKRNKSVGSHLVASGHITGRQNGIAIAGDFISAATFLGTTGAIAMLGFNGFYYAVYIPIAYLLAMLLVAEPLRNLGQFTLGDVLARRFPAANVRGAIAMSSVFLSLIYIVAQFVGAAVLIKLLFGIEYWAAAAIIGLLTAIYTLFGGMLATTYIQIVKTAILLACGMILILLVLNNFGWNPLELFRQAADATAANPPAALEPARPGLIQQINQFSLILGVTIGVLGLPHVMIRFLTVRNSDEARTSAVTAIWIFAGFLIFLPVLGYGAMLLVENGRAGLGGGGNLAMPELAKVLGGDLLLSFVSAVAFATILAALSGLVIATSGAVAHDLYTKLLKQGRVGPKQQLTVARVATVGAVVVSLLISLAVEQFNVAFLATLAITVSASANLPAILGTIYWRRVTSQGVFYGMVAGLSLSVGMIILSPTFFDLIPITAPGIISIPVGFLTMWLVSLATQPKGESLAKANETFDRMRIQAVTGVDPYDPDYVPPEHRASAH
ncbi:MAG: cation acetate symporter [Actinomycetales bacterium]|nr:MAG: cation acetate symporter [Actinomycetales bacterium]